jgi:hypothetical protein
VAQLMAADSEQIQFDGEGEYVEHRRHKSIFDARQTARDVILSAKRQHSRGEISVDEMRADARTAVELYITEVEQMAAISKKQEVLRGTQIHTVRVNPPDSLLQYYGDNAHRALSDRPQPKVAANGEVTGLRGFLEAPELFRAAWTIRVDVRHEGPQRITKSAAVRMPVTASLNAFRTVNRFLQDTGLDIEPRLPDYMGGDEPGL